MTNKKQSENKGSMELKQVVTEIGPSKIESSILKGLTVWQASLFLIGEVAGSGMLSLPNAILGTGWIGFFLLTLFCIMACYAGVRLGTCWTILEERYEECRKEVHSPFMTIAEKAYGPKMRTFVNICMDINLFGDCVVYLLVMAAMIQALFQPVWNISICYWQMMLACVLAPLTWFGTPKDFWGLAAAGTATVVTAALLLFIQSILDIGKYENVSYPAPELKGFSLAFGAILFGYGGAAVFPTIQNDMKHRKLFPKSAAYAFAGTLAIYAPLSIGGYFIYGQYNGITSNLATTVTNGPLRIIAQVLLISHIMFAFVIVMNPLYQEFEHRLHIGDKFCWKRCLFRTIVLVIVLSIGETVPQFGKVLNLIGGSTSMSLSFIFPILFYKKLVSQKNPQWKEREIPLHETVFIWEIIFIGVIGGIASTVSAVWDIASPDAFSLPCFISAPVPNLTNQLNSVTRTSCS